MKTVKTISGLIVAAVIASIGTASAQVNPDDFNTLKDAVQKLNQQMQELMKNREADQKRHEEDQKTIENLQKQLGDTQRLATNAQQMADATAKVQSSYPAVSGAMNSTHNFMMVGDAEVQFGKTSGQHSAFVLADFAPIFLFRASDNVLFEAGFDITLQNGTQESGGGSSTHVDLSFAQLDYLMNNYLTIVAGDMLLPLGTYSERAAGFLNKIPDDPLARDLLPGSGVGLQLRGAVPIGQYADSLTYAAYVVNGPSSTDGTGNSGSLDLGGNVGDTPNWHANPSYGGRLGWFHPFKAHYDFELGISGQTGEWDNAGNRRWSAGVFDAAVHIGPYFEAKGEYIRTMVETDDIGTMRPRGWWAQAGYKLAGLNLDAPLIHNIEIVGRYDESNDGLGVRTDRYTMGYVYYFSNTFLFEGDYEWLHGDDAHNMFVFQLSYGF
jgi:hypothetical protein